MAGAPQQLPLRFGKYELEEFLGGGMSHVYRARDTVIGRTVAVKILTDAGCADPDARARFVAEGHMAGNISHENVLGIYDFGFDSYQRPFMVMEFLRGEDLRNAIRNGRTGDLKSKLKIALQVARAIKYIHGLNIVHRDIKPENIYLNQAGVAKLIDFGIAKVEDVNLTRAGYVVGTPSYMAPEQIRGEVATPQVDVYAFGLLLYELLTGVKPLQSNTLEGITYAILNQPLKMEPLTQAAIPRPVCDLVAACAAKSPDARPRGFTPLVAALEAQLSALDRVPHRHRRRSGRLFARRGWGRGWRFC